jgi:acetyl-CoA C-acetyltransferase
VESFTVNKVCGSALKAVMLGVQAIRCGDADVVVAGGMESMTRAPYYLDKARWGHRMGPGTLEDHMVHDGLWDVVNDFHMGMSNELISEKWEISREAQDRFAEESYRRAMLALESNVFAEEISPIEVSAGRGKTTLFAKDECPQPTTFAQLQKMRPAFCKDGFGTAGNASIISDGAAAVVLMSREKAADLGCRIMAVAGAQASAAIDLKYVLCAPILAIPKVLAKEGISQGDIELFEINEAFSGASCAINKELDLNTDIINVNGGAVAMGHPIGASGGRLLVTLLYEMQRRNAKRGLVTLCLGGGEAVAMIVNRHNI